MNFIAPDPAMIRRSECGQYLIEKAAIYHTEPCEKTADHLHTWKHDGSTCVECGATRLCYRYVLWQYTRSLHGFDSAQDAVDEATSLQAQAAAVWARAKAAADQDACATPESASPPHEAATG